MRTAPLPAFALCLAIGCAASSAFAQRGDRANDPQPEPTFDLPPPAPLDPTEARAAFTLQPGYRIEAFATEPMVQAPVALAFAADGAAWVVEMRGYMNDVDAGGEDQPIGRIVVLRDTDGDGRADVAKTFLDAVVMPRAVLPMRGGALVVVPPLLVWCPDADGDGVADRMETVVGGFDAGLSNPEHAGNGPVVGFDGWISFCNYPLALRRVSGSAWATRATFGGGQWGHGHDDFGRLWFDYNSDGLRVDVLPSHLALHRTLGAMPGLNVQALRDQSVFPIRATPGINRGYQKGLLKDNRLAVFTAACGVVVDRGGVVSDGDAFLCEPAGHVVRRCEVTWDATGRPTARNAYAGAEWLASTDERFRPVNLAVGLDGAIYVVDMYRGVLQHRNFVTTWLRKQIVARELETPLDRGRIWRVVREPAGERADAPLGVAGRSESELVALLTDRNGVVRDLAQQALVEIGPALADATAAALSRLAANGDDARWRLHALWTLARTGRLAADAWRARLADEHPQVRAAALRVAFDERPPTVDAATARAAMLAALDDASIEVRRVAMLLAARVAPSDDRVFVALLRDGGDAMVRGGYLIGNVGRELDVLRNVVTEWTDGAVPTFAKPLVTDLARAVVKSGDAQRVAALRELREPAWLVAAIASTLPKSLAPAPALSAEQAARFEHGRKLYAVHCGICHQPQGQGLEGLAPPLAESDWVTGSEATLIRIVRHGLVGPIDVRGKRYELAMPGLPHLRDEDVAAVLTFIRREFGDGAAPVEPATVRAVRSADGQRTTPWTALELDKSK